MARLQILRNSKRYISVSQTSVVTTSPSDQSNSQLLQNAETLPTTTTSDPQFQVLGTPPTLLSISLTPSIPITIKKGSLISLSGGSQSTSSNESVSSQWQTISPLKSFIYGRFTTSYQRIVTTIPYNALISSVAKSIWNKKSVSQKSLVSILLDGRVDWAVLAPRAVQAYCGPSLSVSIEKLPGKVSAALAKNLNIPRSTSTGLHSWKQLGFSFISGRGQVALSGDGQIYRIILKENEEFLINKKNLLAVSINGESDLSNCVASYILPSNLSTKKPDAQSKPSTSNSWMKIGESIMSFFKTTTNYTYNTIVGNNSYVKIIGPRNVLLQTNTNAQLSQALKSFSFTKDDISKTELRIKDVQDLTSPLRKSSDYLKIATVSDGKVEFKSTENFQDAVKKIS